MSMKATISIAQVSLEVLDCVAQMLAAQLVPGDVVTLSGELGAGKTSFAKPLVRAFIADEERDIPSPTFTLLQTYCGARGEVCHFDLYRLNSPEEVIEIGFEDALESSVSLVEWPDRAADFLPNDRLDILIAETGISSERQLVLTGLGAWAPRLQRLDQLRRFLSDCGWAAARATFMQGDASSRSYVRLSRGGDTAVLMNSPAMADGPIIRGGQSYSQIAHLAENVVPFVAVASALDAIGLSVPSVLAQDLDKGFLLLEDLGSTTFSNAMAGSHTMAEVYRKAVQVLLTLRAAPPASELPVPGGNHGQVHRLAHFDGQALGIEVELLLDWYWQIGDRPKPDEASRVEFLGLWTHLFDAISSERHWVLRDFHSPNLMLIARQEGLREIGVIDFQDAMRGPAAYDLVSLLQDARVTVPQDLEEKLLASYCTAASGMADFEEHDFRRAYAILGAQRNTKILGIFARLAKRDGKPGYLAHLPRIWTYLERNLRDPALNDLQDWYVRRFPEEISA